jgi:N6-L-threonylcarbamoyladenine synthase
VAATLDKLTENLRERYESIPIVYAGGVMSNEIIKRRLSKREGVYFSAPMFSADNAAGISLLCRKQYLKI